MMLPQNKNYKPKRGFNLIELAFVLMVVGAALGGLWLGVSTVLEEMKVSKTLNDVQMITRNTQNFISSAEAQIIGSGTIEHQAKNAGVFPRDWVDGAGNVINPFGGDVSLVNQVIEFHFALHNIPQSACTKLVARTSAIGAADSGGNVASFRSTISRISVNGGNFSSTTFPISPATAATACNLASNYMLLVFYYTR